MSAIEGEQPDDHSMRHHVEEVRYVSADKRLEVVFEDGREFSLPAEYLRVESPSAEVQGHVPGQKQIVPGRRHVGIMGLEPVGTYALRIKFDDLHNTGIYSWDYLYRLGEQQDVLWATYLDNLAAKGLSRDP